MGGKDSFHPLTAVKTFTLTLFLSLALATNGVQAEPLRDGLQDRRLRKAEKRVHEGCRAARHLHFHGIDDPPRAPW